MKKISTFFKSLFVIVLLFGSVVGNAQVEEAWNQTHDWNNGYASRGIAYSDVTGHLYVAAGVWGEATGENQKIKVLDPFTGEELKELVLGAGFSGLGYGVHDVEVDAAGAIFATMTTTNKWHPIKIIYWANEDANAELLWTDESGESIPHGPGFSVKGNYANGESLIILPQYTKNAVYYFESTNGVLGAVNTLTLVGVTGGKNISIEALGNRIVDGFWYDNNNLDDASVIDGSGNIIDALDNVDFLATGDQSGVKLFSADDKDYLTVGTQGDVYLVDVTEVTDFSTVTLDDTVQVIKGTDPSPEWSTPAGYGQEEIIVTFATGGYAIISLAGDRYIKAISTDEAPMALNALATGFAMVDSTIQVSYMYADINGDLEGDSEFKWFTSDDDLGTNKTEVGTETSYTVKDTDLGKYLSFSVFPVALTGIVKDSSNLVESMFYGPVAPSGAKAPVATIDTIKGDVQVDAVLTAEYTYYDENDDLEGESILKWYRADNELGENKVEVASDTLMYKLLPADDNKYIVFSVTPIAQTGVLLEGETVTRVADSVVFFPKFLPIATNVAIAGIEEVTRTLTGSYDYSDLNSDKEGTTVFTWYRADTEDGVKTAVATDTIMYKLVAADEAKYVFFGVKPVTVDGEEGVEAFANTGEIQATPPEEPPVASDVKVSGNPEVGAVLSGSYSYFDYTSDTEGETIFKWYTADDVAGTNATIIAGANKQTLLVEEAQLGKVIIFEVSPVATSGGLLVGDPISDTTSTATVPSSREFGLERMWLASTKTGAAPYYINPAVTTERGFAIGEEHIYIASRYDGIKVVIIDKEDGSYVGELSTTGITGGTYAINDIEVSDDGQILAAPLDGGAKFWIYKWENELADPEKWLEVTLPSEISGRLGDKFSVTGDLTGDAIIMAVESGGNNILRWVVTGGIVGDVEILTLNGITSTETSPAAVPFSPNADANILVDGKGFAPTIFDKDGNIVGSVAMVDNYGEFKIQSNSPNVFNHKGRTMAAFFQAMRKEPLGARIIVADITSKPYRIVDSTEYVSNSMSWDGYLGEVDITVDEDYYYAHMLQAKNAVARYRGELEFPEFASAITTWEGDKIDVEFTKNIDAATVDSVKNWTIKADDIAIEISSISAENSIINFVLASNLEEGQVVTIEYDGLGGVIAFDAMPLNLFGPVSVFSIVGADVPEASAVSYIIDITDNYTLTASYTYSDDDGDLEGESEYQWYYASNADGSDKLKIIGETNLTYILTNDMADKYISFEVTPVSVTGGDDYLVGEPVMSVYKIVTEIKEIFAGNLNIYPNPVNDVLTIDNCTEVTTIRVFDITGRVLSVLQNTGDNKLNIDVSSWKSGVFLIQLNGEKGQTKVERIIKN